MNLELVAIYYLYKTTRKIKTMKVDKIRELSLEGLKKTALAKVCDIELLFDTNAHLTYQMVEAYRLKKEAVNVYDLQSLKDSDLGILYQLKGILFELSKGRIHIYEVERQLAKDKGGHLSIIGDDVYITSDRISTAKRLLNEVTARVLRRYNAFPNPQYPASEHIMNLKLKS